MRFLIGLVVYIMTTLGALAQLQGSGVPYYPQTLPAQTLVGRYSTSPGPTEAIPFSVFYAGIGTQILAGTNNWAGAQTFSGNVVFAGASVFTLNGSGSGTVTLKPAAAAGTWTFTLPTTAGTANQAMLTNGSGVASWNWAGFNIGSNPITGGTTGRVLYDSAGVVGELATTGSGNVVLATSPTIATATLTTPTATGLTTLAKVATSGTAPALSSCGTSPTIVGSDTAGTITMGTGGPTTCTITFNAAYTAVPICILRWQTTIGTMTYTTSTSAISVTQTSTSSNKIDYHCIAQNGG